MPVRALTPMQRTLTISLCFDDTMPERLSAATCLLRMSARLRQLRNRPIAVKLGGSAMEDADATTSVLSSCVALQSFGVRIVIIHGGGKPIDREMAKANLTPKKISGIRYTDDETLEIVVRVLQELNAGLRREFADLGGKVAGFIGEPDVWPLRGERMLLPGLDLQPVDLGHVGKVTTVEHSIHDLLAMESVPILPSLAVGPDSQWLNVNADSVASAIGGAIRAESIYFLTDTPGVLRERANPESLIRHLRESDARSMIADGTIAGGMIPKVEACFDALAHGIDRAVILDGRDPTTLLADFALDQPSGTVITK